MCLVERRPLIMIIYADEAAGEESSVSPPAEELNSADQAFTLTTGELERHKQTDTRGNPQWSPRAAPVKHPSNKGTGWHVGTFLQLSFCLETLKQRRSRAGTKYFRGQKAIYTWNMSKQIHKLQSEVVFICSVYLCCTLLCVFTAASPCPISTRGFYLKNMSVIQIPGEIGFFIFLFFSWIDSISAGFCVCVRVGVVFMIVFVWVCEHSCVHSWFCVGEYLCECVCVCVCESECSCVTAGVWQRKW